MDNIEKVIRTLNRIKEFDYHKDDDSNMTEAYRERVRADIGLAVKALEKQLSGGWIPVRERLPENNTKVQVTGVSYSGYTKTNRYVCFNAKYVGKNTVKVDDMWAYCECDDLQVYNEEKDTFYVEEGWYESIENWDDYTDIYVSEYEIIAWRPLPELYKEIENDEDNFNYQQ